MSEKSASGPSAPSPWEAVWKQTTEAWQQAVAKAATGSWPTDAAWADPVEQWKQWSELWWQGMGQGHPSAGAGQAGAAPAGAAPAGAAPAGGSAQGHEAETGPGGVFGAGMGPLGAGMGPFGAGMGPFGAGMGPLGAGMGPLGAGMGPLGAGMGPLGAGMGPLGAGMGPLGAGMGPLGAGAELYGELGRFWLRAVMESAQKGPKAWQEAFGQERLGELQRIFSRQLGRLADGVALYPFGPALSSYLGGVTHLSDLGGQLWVRLLGPWGESLRELLSTWQKAVQGDPEAFRRFVQTWKETYDKTHGRLLQAPLLGYSREPAERLTRSLDAFVDYLATVQEFVSALDRVGRTAIGRFSGRATELAADGTIPGHKQLWRLYIDTFEESFLEVFQSKEYGRLQSQMVSAGLRFKKRLDGALEDLLGLLPIPTDSEMRELYSAFYELRKTVKTQRRQIAALEARLAALEGSGAAPRGEGAGEPRSGREP